MIDLFKYGNIDWWVFIGATRVFLHGGNPYTFQMGNEIWNRVFEPPWTYVLLSPLAILPVEVGRLVGFIVGFAVYGYSAIRMKANRWQLPMFMLSLPVIGTLYQGNIDWLVTAGFWMPPQIGLFFVLMKPQVGIGVAIFWAYSAWIEGGPKKVIYLFAPVTLAYLSSFYFYGFWVSNMIGMPNNPVSVSLFPYGTVIGIALLVVACKLRQQNISAIASPLMAPYFTLFNLSGSLISMFDRKRLFLIAWLLLWVPTLIKFFIS